MMPFEEMPNNSSQHGGGGVIHKLPAAVAQEAAQQRLYMSPANE